MKSVMISVKPEGCELIASGNKTIEVLKTKPNCDVPFKCYIYEAHDKSKKYYNTFHENTVGKVIGEFICDNINTYTAEFVDDGCYESIHQVFGEDDTSYVTSNEEENPNDCFLCKQSCIDFKYIKKYVGVCFHDKPFYGWHISDLHIYDKPKDITEFKSRQLVWEGNNHIHRYREMKRPPQSWCYVEE